jgi:hypothetical protein
MGLTESGSSGGSACAKAVPAIAANAIQVRITFIEGPPDILPITLEREGALPRENNVGADSRLDAGGGRMARRGPSKEVGYQVVFTSVFPAL